ncbi:uncharacterized protein LOC111024183 isoform X2 [Momordica charantia]|uniref:Uncharacterized protein LOC111024183 isoform X2 n=1 Tax=Momordica charantia TaxID=3673 RepID=A0A6J1DTH6_MOMCH|nr:uncharacterized protein LOC111024183 isoform X2 [Momordica charantia]
MVAKRLVSIFKRSPTTQPSSSIKPAEEGVNKFWGRKAVSFVLITVTGGVALSALDDLAIYHSCSSKAIEKARNNQALRDAIGEPIVKGPWYNASLAVAHKRHSLSCTFPVSGPQGTGILQLKAVRSGEESWISFVRPREWDILIMDALLHVPANQGKEQTLRINLTEKFPPAACVACQPPDTDTHQR